MISLQKSARKVSSKAVLHGPSSWFSSRHVGFELGNLSILIQFRY